MIITIFTNSCYRRFSHSRFPGKHFNWNFAKHAFLVLKYGRLLWPKQGYFYETN